ncbi:MULTISPECIES: GTPase Era [Clostridium]|jgi:GTP-binding protein Era|uniref:GTPase Era n=1 Tax=Clostridium saccharoperbutylacetonicum N1-4(HMT) TaxID=931276 RepID=M1M9S9_9CLOT|nr:MULTISPECIES: GTPase Era [Clostridium]AGF54709.1 GTPase Era [Clostridium saccharoperbutylacetonicum N1-4(HMT)]AQR93664.1 GTPase Era [Clostridium saccharoperbutylacetonicum]NRT58770.1 GTP-binding protein Era [Clostridium saccharoperbutylacetonicum]NSB27959.1 GTP-binding protein Era [Clostridium saccharoperbutylacetonicum]NSB29363.1 GTP-binding protein Era [Clostridium saccharoperbutylacetonicum]
MFKSGFVTIVGRPNVGKSTLLNYIMGEKLSIVSNKPQTTRNNIQTILTGEDYQMVFVDTPGIHKPKHKLGEYMVNSAKESTKDVDLVLFLTNPDEEIGKGDKFILETLRDKKCPVFLVLNKVDESTQDRVAKSLQMYAEEFKFAEIIPISAIKGKNVDKLLELMKNSMPEGPKYYPDDMITDVQEKFVVSEIIREKALRTLRDEVPHGIAVDIIQMKQNEKGTYHIEVDLICEKDSHKGIIIGKNGQTLKRIGETARYELERFLRSKVNVKIWVKVRKEWRDNQNLLKELGYKAKK